MIKKILSTLTLALYMLNVGSFAASPGTEQLMQKALRSRSPLIPLAFGLSIGALSAKLFYSREAKIKNLQDYNVIEEIKSNENEYVTPPAVQPSSSCDTNLSEKIDTQATKSISVAATQTDGNLIEITPNVVVVDASTSTDITTDSPTDLVITTGDKDETSYTKAALKVAGGLAVITAAYFGIKYVMSPEGKKKVKGVVTGVTERVRNAFSTVHSFFYGSIDSDSEEIDISPTEVADGQSAVHVRRIDPQNWYTLQSYSGLFTRQQFPIPQQNIRNIWMLWYFSEVNLASLGVNVNIVESLPELILSDNEDELEDIPHIHLAADSVVFHATRDDASRLPQQPIRFSVGVNANLSTSGYISGPAASSHASLLGAFAYGPLRVIPENNPAEETSSRRAVIFRNSGPLHHLGFPSSNSETGLTLPEMLMPAGYQTSPLIDDESSSDSDNQENSIENTTSPRPNSAGHEIPPIPNQTAEQALAETRMGAVVNLAMHQQSAQQIARTQAALLMSGEIHAQAAEEIRATQGVVAENRVATMATGVALLSHRQETEARLRRIEEQHQAHLEHLSGELESAKYDMLTASAAASASRNGWREEAAKNRDLERKYTEDVQGLQSRLAEASSALRAQRIMSAQSITAQAVEAPIGIIASAASSAVVSMASAAYQQQPELEARLASAKENIEELKERNVWLFRQLEGRANRMKQFQATVSQHQRSVIAKTKELDTARSTIHTLERQITHIAGEVKSKVDLVTSLSTRLSESESIGAGYSEEISALQTTIRGLPTQVDLETIIRKNTELQAQFANRLEEAQAHINELESRHTDRESFIGGLQSQVEQLQHQPEKSELSTKSNLTSSDISNLEEEIAELRERIETERARNESLQQITIANANARAAAEEAKYLKLKAEVDEFTRVVAPRLQDQIKEGEEAKRDLEDIQYKMKIVEDESNNLQAHLTQAQLDLFESQQSHNAELEDLRGRLHEAEQDKTDAQARVGIAQAAKNTAEEALSSLREEYNNLAAQLASLHGDLNDARAAAVTAQEALSAIVIEKENLEINFSLMENSLRDTEEKLQSAVERDIQPLTPTRLSKLQQFVSAPDPASKKALESILNAYTDNNMKSRRGADMDVLNAIGGRNYSTYLETLHQIE